VRRVARSVTVFALLSTVLVAACQDCQDPRPVEDGVSEVVPTAPPEETAPDPSEVRLFKRSRPMMGTIFQITVAGEPDSTAAPAVEAALDEIERLEEVLSEWREDSEISRINANAGGDPVTVSADTFRVVKAGVQVGRWSGGAFDLSWAALRGLYDFRPDSKRIPDRSEVVPRLRLIDYEKIEIDEENYTVRLGMEGMEIGTGGIGKGYALDRAADILKERGMESFMLFGGGQVQVHGMRGDRPWRVGIQHPRRDDYFAFLEATEGTISTSGDYEHFFIDENGKRWHHILDTSTGLPVEHTLSVTVIAPSGVYGDALSTACFVRGAEGCLEMLERVPGETGAVIVTSDFEVVTTPNVRDRLRWNMRLDADGKLPH
jgi:thiamine biosynthesis lipoprotein